MNDDSIILYLCRHNIFRSRIAQIYTRQKGLGAESAGLIPWETAPEDLPIQQRVAREFGFDLSLDSKPVTYGLLKRTGRLIIVANDVPSEIFNHPLYQLEGKIERWDLPDVRPEHVEEDTRETIRQIIRRVDTL